MLTLKTLEWIGPPSLDRTTAGLPGHLRLLDQTRLPGETVYLDCRSVEDVWGAIRRLSVRGAPAIGIAAAYGCVVGVQELPRSDWSNESKVRGALAAAAAHLATSRPTAVNLFWALERMKRVAPCTPQALLGEARKIHDEDAAMCRQIGEHALVIFQRLAGVGRGESRTAGELESTKWSAGAGVSPAAADGLGVLTHCNAGALATGGIGTATAGMYLAKERCLPLTVFADETRPLLQGARLTAFELAAAGIDVTLICDDMAAQVMREGRVQLVITGADRIAANGDAANKIGTYGLAVLARHHGLPFYIAAPSSTFDLSIPDGGHIPIEQRAAEEITEGFGRRTAPPGVKTYSPAFDVTPHTLIDGIITERGVIAPVNADTVRKALA